MLRPNVLLAMVRIIETAMVITIMYLYGINALAYPYVVIPMLMLTMAITFLLIKLIGLVIDIQPLTAQRLILVTLVIDLVINIYLAYLSIIELGLIYIMMLLMLFFINISVTLVLIALYAKLQ